MMLTLILHVVGVAEKKHGVMAVVCGHVIAVKNMAPVCVLKETH